MASAWYSVVLIAVCLGSSSDAATPKLFCYLDGSAQFLTGNGTYGFANVPENTCDVIVFRGGFFPLTDGSVYFEDPFAFSAFVADAVVRDRSQVFVTIGDPTSGATLPAASRLSTFRSIVADASSRANLVRSIGELVAEHGLDGIEIDWQDGLVSDAANLVLFLKELQGSLDYVVLISLVVVYDAAYGFDKYSVSETNGFVDYFSVRTFDYVDTSLDITQLGSPFSRQQQDVQHILSTGVSRAKVILNVPLHAYTFHLADPELHAVGAASLAAGPAGPSTGQPGRMTYREVTDYLDAKGTAATVEYTDYTPFAYSGHDWIAFEDVQTVGFKCRAAFMLGLNIGLQSISEDQSDPNKAAEQLTPACRLATYRVIY